MKYMFDTEVAAVVGTAAAAIYENICFWIFKNQANERHYHDGKYWTYSSVKAFGEIFHFLSTKQINNCLDKLIEEGYLVTGNYNTNPIDRTRWYALGERPHDLPKRENGCDFPSGEKASPQKGKCINKETDRNTDSSHSQRADALTTEPELIIERNLFPELGEKEKGSAQKEKEGMFRTSRLYEIRRDPVSLLYDETYGAPYWESKFPKAYQDVDLVYYYDQVFEWSEKNSKVKRSERGWIATGRTFMKGDSEKGRLKMKNQPTNGAGYNYAAAVSILSDDEL